MHALDHRHTDPRRWALLVAGALLAASPAALAVQAGKVVFVAGSVTLEAGNRALHGGDPISTGDTVVTGPAARAQLLMGDGARIALRSESRFRIDAFELGAAVRSPAATTVAASTGRSLSTLLKGGFRTASGSIGKGDPAAYEVRVPIGTLGIRGTDYVAVFCRGDCVDAPGLKAGERVRDGLYLGVYTGSIVYRGGGLEVPVSAGEFVFIPVPELKPERLHEPPGPVVGDGAGRLDLGGGPAGAQVRPSLKDRGLGALSSRPVPALPPATDTAQPAGTTALPVGGTANGVPIDLTPGQLPTRNDSAAATGPVPGVASPGSSAAQTTLYAFGGATGGATALPVQVPGVAAAASLQIGTAVASDSGFSAATGLRWGRWSGGSVHLVGSAIVGGPVPLGTDSVHWVVGASYADAATPVLPQTGTAVYSLVGATHPTDGLGNLGTLNSLTLTADFRASAVAAALSLTIAKLDWIATGSGFILAPGKSSGPQFAGTFSAPSVGGATQIGGGGAFSGFFSNVPGQTSGVPGAAGISYTLFVPRAGSVSGVAALVGK